MAKLFLLDGMALVYRAHFALIRSPIYTSGGLNTSAVLGFTNTLLEIIQKWKPTHLAVVFDTSAPTERHKEFEGYKATRQEMPEDLSTALPYVDRIIEGFQLPSIRLDGYEADDIIGTLAKKAELEGFDVFMATPDKDFGQLVSEKIKIFKPGRMGSDTEILGVDEIKSKWGIERIDQVIDILGLMGDTVDNIPGVPGIGEKTAAKLISQFGTIENLLASIGQLKGKQKEVIEANAEMARLSRRLATIDLNVPIEVVWDTLFIKEPDPNLLKPLFVELEFNAIGKRLFGDEFKAGRGFQPVSSGGGETQGDLFESAPTLRTRSEEASLYKKLETEEEAKKWVAAFTGEEIGISMDGGVTLCAKKGESVWIPMILLGTVSEIFANPKIRKVGAGIKEDLKTLLKLSIPLAGVFEDVEIAHALVDPEARHRLPYLAERYLGYSMLPEDAPADERAMERADVALQIAPSLRAQLTERNQTKVLEEIESPLTLALARMEVTGIAIDIPALKEYSVALGAEIQRVQDRVFEIAGEPFNLGSPKQLGTILFEKLQLGEKPKKTKTGQFSTNEAVLEALAAKHEIAKLIMDHREMSKLKSTYVDALPLAVDSETKRVHTTFYQVSTSTGRLASQNPNLQNIPIRTERGREIRKAFVPGEPGYSLLAMDYSQIELRIMAEISEDAGMREAFTQGIDIHTATAAKVYGVDLNTVDSDMRRTAKMVNFGIIYGISPFGLAQRLGIPRGEASTIINQYFAQYSGVKQYMTDTIQFARQNGYVETMTGRRRFVRDVTSQNATVRQAAERNAINMPIQGTAADMIKIAMAAIDRELVAGKFKTRMMLQVHDELLFELCDEEKETVVPLIKELMQNALPMQVPIVVEAGVGPNWLAAH